MPLDDSVPIEVPLLQAFSAALGRQPEGADAFIGSVAADYRADELGGFSPDDLAAALADFWRFGEEAGEGLAIRFVSAETADRLEIVQPDAPFLVDSVMGEVAESRAGVKAMFHPLVETPRGVRSMIQVWLEPLSRTRERMLMAGVRTALEDVRVAVDDFAAMTALMRRTITELAKAAPGDPERLAEEIAFLEWLAAGHFVFLGARVYEYPRSEDGAYAAEAPLYQPEGSLGVLRDQQRMVLRQGSEPAVLSAVLRRSLTEAAPLVVAKANLRSRVHRRGHMDYVGVRRYGADGRPSGEVRFVGLFTAQAYDEPAHDVPLIRRKVAGVLARAGFAEDSHNWTRLVNILEGWPRDELFQSSEDELLAMALGVLHLSDRPRVKLFLRRDPFDRFVSALFFAPRERYDAALIQRAGEILAHAFGGRVSAAYPSYGDAPLARAHFIIGLEPGRHAEPDPAALETELVAAARTWADEFEDEARRRDPDHAGETPERFASAFPAGYRERFGAADALDDIAAFTPLANEGDVAVRAYHREDDGPCGFRFKLYRLGEEPAILSDAAPIIETMGLRALTEDAYQIRWESRSVWAHEFVVRAAEALEFDALKAPFEAAVLAIWQGRAESDGFNRLVVELGAGWREAALIRTLARYRAQSGLDPTQAVQEEAVSLHEPVTRLILRLFAEKFDPATGKSVEDRKAAAEATSAEIEAALQAVESLDHDRVLRRLAGVVAAATRTNFYQTGPDGGAKPYISIKVASREIAELPAPKPYREIYVSSPQVEGVHLRFGPVARGGLRWSDRRDDFRTEVLGLVKAQQVKNAVIVPVGSKGGFYPKQLPRGGAPEQTRAAAVEAYKTFLAGLLDLTDNIDAQNRVIRPEGVIAHDEDDPYLVVAADKGTATFSDIANGVAAEYGFWLGDAFASGGSAGYDHKAMGITARGAWEAVKRHFRELGKDIQSQPFTVIGVGDMSGDVFGNGMLLSKQIRLIAAFDHRHVFVDPDPDPAASFAERERLFALPRSSWDDYDKAKISKGGGVFARALKSVPISEEMKAVLGLRGDSLTPAELINGILKAPAELLYLGGIGAYVKASDESHPEVGDKANDAIRVNGRDLKVKVVGEGANLGVTQRGRVEFALAGGRIDTDAIDNSAGVDTSDHEVNIKILTSLAERAGKLKAEEREPLLAAMTDEVARQVLRHNYDQGQALSLLEAEALAETDAHEAFMARLESAGRLDRTLEFLPAKDELQARARSGRGLTRPELAVLLAYGKLELSDAVVDSSAPDDPYFERTLRDYFPSHLAPFADQMQQHRLRREIIATVLANAIVNRLGPTFPSRLRSSTGADTAATVVAYEAAWQTMRLGDIWSEVEKLDGKAPAAGQTALLRELAYLLRGQTYWFARRLVREPASVRSLIDAYRPGTDNLKELIPSVLSTFEQREAVRRADRWIKAGAPRDLAHAVAVLRPLTLAGTLTDLSKATAWPFDPVARLYHQIGGAFDFDKLRAAAGSRVSGDMYERLAVRRLVEDLTHDQGLVTRAVIDFAGRHESSDTPQAAKKTVSAWAQLRSGAARNVRNTIAGIEKSDGPWTFAKLTIATAALRELATAS